MNAHGVFSVTAGAGPRAPVIVVHGLGLDHTSWDALSAALSPSRQVIRVDVRGHGRTPLRGAGHALDDLADDVANVLTSYGITKADFVGLSMGGMIGQHFALRYPEKLNRLVLTCTASAYGPEAQPMWDARIALVKEKGMAGVVDTLLARFFSPTFLALGGETIVRTRQRLLTTDAAGYVAGCETIRKLNVTSQLASVRAPTLVISGGADISLPPALGRQIAEHVPSAQYVEIANAGHLASEEFPEIFNGHISCFLDA